MFGRRLSSMLLLSIPFLLWSPLPRVDLLTARL